MTTQTRRQAISSAAKFVIPTVTAFALSEVQVAASGFTKPGNKPPKKPKPPRPRRPRW